MGKGGYMIPSGNITNPFNAGKFALCRNFSVSGIIDKNERQKPADVVLKCEQRNLHGEIIGKLASSRYYVKSDIPVDSLADVMNNNKEIFAVGVISHENDSILGIVLRNELLGVLSKLYGRDIYKNKPVSELMTSTEVFNYKTNIFAFANDMPNFSKKTDNRYFILKDNNDMFVGIFSTRDILVYLSEITQKDINLAKSLQSCIIKDEILVNEDNFDIIGATMMARDVGGDFYSAHKYSDDNWFISLCDVSGKGISASLLSVTIGGMVHLYDFNDGIENFIVKLNEYVYNTFGSEKFITGVFIDYNDKSGEMIIYDMGHSYIYIKRNGIVSRIKLKSENFPVGISLDCRPRCGKFIMSADDTVVVCTDGFEEQKNPEGQEFGTERLFDSIRNNIGVKEICYDLFDNIKDFQQNQPQNDDMTIIIVQKKFEGE